MLVLPLADISSALEQRRGTVEGTCILILNEYRPCPLRFVVERDGLLRLIPFFVMWSKLTSSFPSCDNWQSHHGVAGDALILIRAVTQ